MSRAGLAEPSEAQLKALRWRYGVVDGSLHTLVEAGEHFDLDWVALALVESRMNQPGS